MDELDNPNVVIINKPNKTNRFLIIIFGLLVVTTLLLTALYFYNQHSPAKVAETNTIPLPVSSPINITNISNSTFFVQDSTLLSGTVGKSYSSTITAGVYESNVQINARATGIPPGLEITSCKTEYNSTQITSTSAKNSLATCTLEGTPTKDGTYTVRFYFSIQGSATEIYKDIPIIIYVQP